MLQLFMLGSAKDPYCWMVGAEELLDVLSKRLLQIMNWGQHHHFHNTIAPAAKHRLRSVVVFKRHSTDSHSQPPISVMTINLFDCFQLKLKTFRTKSLHIINRCIFSAPKKNSKKQQQPCLLNLCSSSLLYHYYICSISPSVPETWNSQSRRTRRCWITEGTLLCSFRTFERLAESGTSSHMSGPWADGYFNGRKYIDYTGVMTCNNSL